MNKSRSILIFEQYIQSDKTRSQYRYHIDQFVEYCHLKSPDSILKLDDSKVKEKLEDYIIFRKNKGNSPNYLRIILFAVQNFCEANDKDGINFKKIRKLVGKKQRPKKTRPYTTEEIKLMLGTTKNLRSKAIILFLSASGVRRGALCELKIGHLREMPNDCLAVTVYADSDEEYTTFINKEAKDSLTRYFERRKKDGEVLDPEHPVFRTKYRLGLEPAKPISEKVISNIIHRAKTNGGVNLEDTPNMLCHAFRRRFNTILKLNNSINPHLIEKLMGHSVAIPLDNAYLQPTLENLFEEYQKGLADLSIDDNTRILEENKKLIVEKSELRKQTDEIGELKKRLEEQLRQESLKIPPSQEQRISAQEKTIELLSNQLLVLQKMVLKNN